MRKVFSKRCAVFVLMILLLSVSLLTACSNYTKSDKEYWFISTSVQFVPYDEKTDNLNDAGTHWTMTANRDCKITISIRGNSRTMYSTTYFYVNENQVRSDPSDFYDFVYTNLELKKGDKLKFHAFWTNSLATDDEGFRFDVFSIDDGTGNYVIDFSK